MNRIMPSTPEAGWEDLARQRLGACMPALMYDEAAVRRSEANIQACWAHSLRRDTSLWSSYVAAVHGGWQARAARAEELAEQGEPAASLAAWQDALSLAPWQPDIQAALEALGQPADKLVIQPPLLAGTGLRVVELHHLPGFGEAAFLASSPPDGEACIADAGSGAVLRRFALPSKRCNGVFPAADGLWVCEQGERQLVQLDYDGNVLARQGLDALGLDGGELIPCLFIRHGTTGWLVAEHAATKKGRLFRVACSGNVLRASPAQAAELPDVRFVHVHDGVVYVGDYERLVLLRSRDGEHFETFMEEPPRGRVCRMTGYGGHLYLVIEYELLVKLNVAGRAVHSSFLPHAFGRGVGCVAPLVVGHGGKTALLVSDFRSACVQRFYVEEIPGVAYSDHG